MNVALLATAAALALAAAPSPAAACDCNHEGKADRAAAGSALAAPEAAAPKKAAKGAQVVKLTVTEDGFVPEVVTVKAGAPVQLVVTRTVEVTCATEIVMKDFGVNQPLPLNKPVTVTVTPKAAGAYRFACAMDMIAGTLKVE
jgi:plastocyanin domain-containing protein